MQIKSILLAFAALSLGSASVIPNPEAATTGVFSAISRRAHPAGSDGALQAAAQAHNWALGQPKSKPKGKSHSRRIEHSVAEGLLDAAAAAHKWALGQKHSRRDHGVSDDVFEPENFALVQADRRKAFEKS
ncbi:hypothetical protein F5Y18DRAFT_378152 [Xylariaceae sp. FL1019]|nr:hypothetical protein F5Y18DRAFT_378152 [Xylariaceae sp. FL1019]